MMKQFRQFALFASLSVIALSCKHGNTAGRSGQINTNEVLSDSADFSFPVTFNYAKGITAENLTGQKRVVILNPDLPADTMAVYIIIPRGAMRPPATKKEQVIEVPARTLACLSTTQVGALPLLGLRDVLIGCTSPELICDTVLSKRAKGGEIRNLGNAMSKNTEQIAALHPEILLRDISQISRTDEALMNTGIHIVLYNEWKEQNLLGRAEWMKFTAMLFGRNTAADSVFNIIEAAYKRIAALVPESEKPISVMYGQDYRGTWYIPGEYSYPTSMMHDAGLRFDYAAGKVSGRPTAFETIFSRHRRDRLWLCMTALPITSIREFIAQNDRYAQFDAVRLGGVYVNTKRLQSNGGNDFWEGALYRPDLLLKDLIVISRPELLPGDTTTYWQKLQ